MNKALFWATLSIFLIWSKPILGQSFFQKLSEISNTEENFKLIQFKKECHGTKSIIIQRQLDLFAKDSITPLSQDIITVLPFEEKLCVAWQDIYELRHQERYSEAIQLCDSVMTYFDWMDSYQKAEIFRIKGNTLSICGDFKGSLEMLKRAEKYFNQSDSDIGKIVASYNIINTYMSFHRWKEFDEHLYLYLDKYGSIIKNFPYLESNYNTLLASQAFIHDDYAKALNFTKMNVALYSELNDSSNIARSSINTALVYDFLEQEDSVITYLELARKFKSGNPHPNQELMGIISMLEFLSKEVYRNKVLEMLNFKNMDEYFLKVTALSTEHSNEEIGLHFYRQKSLFYAENGDYKNAYLAVEQENSTLYGILDQDTLNTALVNYRFELEQAKNKELNYQYAINNQEKEALEEEVKKRRTWIITITIIASLFITLILLRNFYSKRNQTIRHQKEMEEVKNKELQKELDITQNKLNAFKQQLLEKLKIIESFADENKEQYTVKLREMKILTEEDWQEFRQLFMASYPKLSDFMKNKSISLTEGELRILMLNKLQFSRTQMSNILAIGRESIRKAEYRLKKKLEPRELEEVLSLF